MAKWSCSTQILPACFAWGLFLILTLLFFAFPCRYIFTELGQVGTITTIYDCVLAVVVFIHFLAATIIDPGKYPKASLTDNENTDHRNPFSKHIDIKGVSFRMKWCTTCQFFRPPRCSHCSVCDTCIDTFDHHCPWVNNCIGRRNYRHFVLFLLSLWIHMISVLALSIISILVWQQNNENLIEVIPIISIIECCLVAILLLPVTGLTTFHLYLISSGRTTNEQVTGKVKADLNPFSKGCIINWVTVFYSSQYPKLITNANQDLLERVNLSKEIAEAEPFMNDNHKVWADNQKVPTVEITDVKDDVSSIASSAIVAELNISARKNRGLQMTNANSKNNLVRIETAPSINDYYVQLDSDPSYSDSVKLVGLNVKNGTAVLKSSQPENLEDISPVDDDNTTLLKQTQ